MPIYPYVPTFTPKPSLIYRTLFKRGIIVVGFVVALVIAILLRNF